MPTYNANIPLATDQISQSQDQILQNFQVLGSFVRGVIDIPVSGSTPSFPSGDIGLYNKNYVYPSGPARNELYITDADGATYPITASFQTGTNGWTILPSGILLKWGEAFANVMSGVSAPIAYGPVNAQTPTFSAVFNVSLTMSTAGTGTDKNTFVQINTFNSTTFTVVASARTSTSAAANNPAFYFTAIGII